MSAATINKIMIGAIATVVGSLLLAYVVNPMLMKSNSESA